MKKVFLHIDLDAFFASVEQLDNPELRGKPVIVGGLPTDRRSVVSTCSYEARKFGVHSAMPVFQAEKLCPHGIFIRPRMKRYHEKSIEVMSIFHEFSPDVQQISVDEAFVDLTGTEKLFGDPVETAKRIKKEVKDKTGLTVSVGLASTKYCAKIASGLSKPDGFFAVEDGKEEEFMLSLPIEKLWGAGAKTLEKLRNAGIKTIPQIHDRSEKLLQSIFGKSTGTFLYNAVRGNENEDFNEKPKNRSISAETTYEYDLYSQDAIETALLELCHTVMFRSLREKVRGKSVSLKIRYEDFSTVSIQETKERYVSSTDDLFERIKLLFSKKYNDRMGIRLLGVGIQNIEDSSKPAPMELFDFGEEKKRKVEEAILKAEQKDPSVKITKARLLGKTFLLPLTFFAILSATNLKLEAESQKETSGAASIVFESDALEEYTPDKVVSIFNKDFAGQHIDFLAEGYWKTSVTGTASVSFGYGSTTATSTSVPVFAQNVDLSLWFMLNKKWYFEAAFADGFEKNTVTAGYTGDGYLKSAKISNRNIIFPEIYSVSDLNRGIGGGDNQAPGISLSWAGQKWRADVAARYDLLSNHEKTWYGKNTVDDDNIELSKYNTGNQYVLPSARLVQNIKNIYVESQNGSYKDSSGTKYKKLPSSQYLLMPSTNTILISNDAKAYIQNGRLPKVAVSFSTSLSQSDIGSYGDPSTFLGAVQEWFGSSFQLSKYSYAYFNAISGEDVLLIQSSAGFSPFVNASKYDCGITRATDAAVTSKTAKTVISDYSAVISDTEVSFTTTDFFYTKHTYADVFITGSENMSPADPKVRFPFGKRSPEIYLGLSCDDDTVLRIRSYSPVSKLEIGTKAVSGTVRVYKNKIIDSGATYNSESGTIELSTGISSGDHIYATWYEDSEDMSTGAVAVAAGFKYDFSENTAADFSIATRWNHGRIKNFADSDYSTDGFATAATSVSYSGENFSIKNTAGATIENQNTTGNYRILGMDDMTSDTTYLTKSSGVDLPSEFTPVLNERTVTDSFPSLDPHKNGSLTSSSSSDGVTDSAITGYAVPLSWNFSTADTTDYPWAARTIKLSESYSTLSSCSFFSIALKNYIYSVSDFDVYLQLGVSTSENFTYENTTTIPTWKISDPTASDVKNAFFPGNAGWQIISVQLSDKDRSAINLSGNSGARLIVVPKNNAVSDSNKISTLLVGPYELELESFNISSSDKAYVGTYQTTDYLLYSSKIKSFNKDSNGDSTRNYVQYFTWKYLEDCTENDTMIFSKYFEEADMSKYKRFSFWIKLNTTSKSKITFSLERPDDSSSSLLSSTEQESKKAVSFTFTSAQLQLCEGWQKITVDLEKKNAQTQFSKTNASVNDSIIPTKFSIIIEHDTPAEGESGELSIDELYFSDIEPYIILQEKLSASWEKDGKIISAGDKTILRDVLISGNGNASSTMETDGSDRQGIISGSAHVSGTLTNIKVTLEGSKDTDEETKNFLSSAYHKFETASPFFNILSFSEEYNFNEPEETLEKNNSIALSLKSLGVPFKIGGDFSANSDTYSKTQIMKASSTFSTKGLSLSAKAGASQKVLVAATKKIDADNYFDSWKRISDFEFSSGDKKASKRDINFSTVAAYNIPFANLKPNVAYTLDGKYKNSSSASFTDSASLVLSLPFAINKNHFDISWKKTAGTTKLSESGGKYNDDLADLRQGMDFEKWFYKAPPIYDLASSRLAKEILKTSSGSNESENISTSSYSCEYSFNWKRQFFGNKYDFFIPAGNTLTFSRDIVASTSESDIYQIKDTVHYSALNIFGQKGNVPVFNFFEQDEYAASLSMAVKIPKENPDERSWYITGYMQSVLYFTEKNSLTSGVEATFETKNDWNGKYTLIWKRNAKNSISAAFSKLFLKKIDRSSLEITKTDSINSSATISTETTSSEVTKKYTVEYSHQVDSQITKYITINSSLGLTYSNKIKEAVTLGATASIGATVKF